MTKLATMPTCRERPHAQSAVQPALGPIMEDQVISRQRVADHGEVLTGPREVNAMLDLVKQETERIESRFLEPACGTGNFLVEILRRKLEVVHKRYRKSQLEFGRNAVLAVSSIYGIDLLEDNVARCRQRLFELFDQRYSAAFGKAARPACRASVEYVLSRNIICGDALTLQTVGGNPEPIVFSEWSPVNGSMFKRRDFAFYELLPRAPSAAPSLFQPGAAPLVSDRGKPAFIPEPVAEYPPVHFLRIADAY